MIVEPSHFWKRVLRTIKGARGLVELDPDGASSRAYYSAFYAASAWFALQQMLFKKHSALVAAVHRDLVRAGMWPVERGEDYNFLMRLRSIGDYGLSTAVSKDEAERAIAAAQRILDAVHQLDPNLFAMSE